MSITKLNADISSAKETPSNLVEWNNNSLNAIVYDIYYLLLSNAAQKVVDTDALENTTPNESSFAIVYGSGLFQWQSLKPASGTYYNALNGGYWVLLANYKGTEHYLSPLTANQEQTITDVEQYPAVPLNGESLVWDGNKWAFTPILAYDGSGGVEKNNTLRYYSDSARWKPFYDKVGIANSNSDYTLTMDEQSVMMRLSASTTKKVYLPSLTINEKGQIFNISLERSNAHARVNISYNGSTIASIQVDLTPSGINFLNSYHTMSLVWTGVDYIPIKRS